MYIELFITFLVYPPSIKIGYRYSFSQFYQHYVNAYKRYYGDEDENYDKINELNSKGKTRDAKAWSKKTGTLERKIVERNLVERNNPKRIILTGPPKRVSLTEEEEEET